MIIDGSLKYGCCFFYMWKLKKIKKLIFKPREIWRNCVFIQLFFFKSLIFIVRTKKIRTIPEMRTSGCLLNCYFCNRSLFMADHNDYDHLFLGWNDHYNFIWMIFLKVLIHDDKSWYCSTGSFPLSEIYPFLSCFLQLVF